LNVTIARSKRTVNLSQHCQTWRSTRHTILRCDEMTGSHDDSVSSDSSAAFSLHSSPAPGSSDAPPTAGYD